MKHLKNLIHGTLIHCKAGERLDMVNLNYRMKLTEAENFTPGFLND